VIAVILFHISGNLDSIGRKTQVSEQILNWGFSGVDVFFVVSGFVMVISQYNSPKNTLRFMKLRVIRIAPLYLLLTTTYSILAFFLPNFFPNFKFTWQYFSASITFLSGVQGYAAPILGQGWTLEFEMLFYLIFSLFLRVRNVTVIGISAIFSISLFIFLFDLNLILLEFCYGVLAGLIYKKIHISRFASLTILLMGMLMNFALLLIQPPSINRAIFAGLPALLIVVGISKFEFSSRLLNELGNASYSSYLTQLFAIPALFHIIEGFGPQRINGNFSLIFVTLVVLLLGSVTYQLVEKPLTVRLKLLFA
jgi:exopolysaccharide production protein ExoZ